MTRAAIYARYSHERQNARSVADQVKVCMRHAEAQGWEVTATFSDAAISGAAMANRPGLLGALQAADRGEYDLLLTEDEDRIARNLEHLAHVANRLRRAGCHLSTLTTGRVETMHVAFKGLIAEDYLRNLSAKTKRGVRANAERGRATGGRLYGYRTRPGGDVEIHETEAAVVRRIFAAYLAGGTARSIAADLNFAGVPAPRGGQWNASTIHGSRQRGYGVLRTELYAGVKVYNRVDKTRDTFTGQRHDITRPKAEWLRTPVPELRIVDEATWTAVQARKEAESACRPHELVRRRPGVFSGLLKCGMCGGSYTVFSSGRLACSTYRERGDSACANRRTLQRAEVEARILAGLQTRLLAPDLVAAWVRAYHQRWRERRAVQTGRRDQLERRLGEIARAELRTIEAIERGTATPAMEARMMEREAERRQLAAELAALQDAEPPYELHPRIAEGYAEQIGKLAQLLNQASAGVLESERELVALARSFVDRIEIKPILQRAGSPYDVTLHGKLASLIRPPEHGENHCMGVLVAGGGIEPPT